MTFGCPSVPIVARYEVHMISVEKWPSVVTDSGRKNVPTVESTWFTMYSRTKPMMGAPKPRWLKRPSAPIVMAAQACTTHDIARMI